MNISSRKNNAGFTLIELLVVISIIGMLSSVVLVSLNSARASGRDASRIQTVAQVRNALELYYSDHKAYPTGGTTVETLVSGPLSPYLSSLSAGFAVSGGAASSYLSNGSQYEILLQTETSAFSKNIGCLAADYSAYAPTSKYCYGNNPTSSLAGAGGGSPGPVTNVALIPEQGIGIGQPSATIEFTWVFPSDTTGMTGYTIDWGEEGGDYQPSISQTCVSSCVAGSGGYHSVDYGPVVELHWLYTITTHYGSQSYSTSGEYEP